METALKATKAKREEWFAKNIDDVEKNRKNFQILSLDAIAAELQPYYGFSFDSDILARVILDVAGDIFEKIEEKDFKQLCEMKTKRDCQSGTLGHCIGRKYSKRVPTKSSSDWAKKLIPVVKVRKGSNAPVGIIVAIMFKYFEFRMKNEKKEKGRAGKIIMTKIGTHATKIMGIVFKDSVVWKLPLDPTLVIGNISANIYIDQDVEALKANFDVITDKVAAIEAVDDRSAINRLKWTNHLLQRNEQEVKDLETRLNLVEKESKELKINKTKLEQEIAAIRCNETIVKQLVTQLTSLGDLYEILKLWVDKKPKVELNEFLRNLKGMDL